jgi:hypothetical protein
MFYDWRMFFARAARRSPIARPEKKPMQPLVNKTRLGPKLQRAGALQDAGATDERPVECADKSPLFCPGTSIVSAEEPGAISPSSWHVDWYRAPFQSGDLSPQSKALGRTRGWRERASVMECGGPPPLWNTTWRANMRNHGLLSPDGVRASCGRLPTATPAKKPMEALVSKTRLGPKLQRAGALQDAARPADAS